MAGPFLGFVLTPAAYVVDRRRSVVRTLILVCVFLILAESVEGQERYVPTVELIERENAWWVLRDGETVKLHRAGVSSQRPICWTISRARVVW